MEDSNINLYEMEFPALEKFVVESLGQPRFRAKQLWQWLWQKNAASFDQMTSISKNLRASLAEHCSLKLPKITATQKADDGTIKFLLELSDQKLVETVLIPSTNRTGQIRWAQCLSTQVGCPMGCAFCATGKMGFTRNLTMGEILAQVLVGKRYLQDDRPDKPILRNLVFMGMGEPLLNLDSLLASLRVLGHKDGLNFSPRRITVSTSGLKHGLKKLGESGLAYLAISLHATTQELRGQIMPGAGVWPLDEMLSDLAQYPIKARERITFEYLLLGGLNDSLEDAKNLVRIASHIKAKINLINFNPVPGLPFRESTAERAQAFQDYLCQHNVTAIMRKSKGADIAAACGQLWAKEAASAPPA